MFFSILQEPGRSNTFLEPSSVCHFNSHVILVIRIYTPPELNVLHVHALTVHALLLLILVIVIILRVLISVVVFLLVVHWSSNLSHATL